MNLDPDPFPGTTTIGIESAPAGPYAVLGPPWKVEPVLPLPPQIDGLAGAWTPLRSRSDPPVGVRLTARVRRMSSRWPTLMSSGATHVRGFDRDGRMLWRGIFDRMSLFEVRGGYGSPTEVSFDLMAPWTMRSIR